jgi:cytoskeletal protein CcmA (bactofilin family)
VSAAHLIGFVLVCLALVTLPFVPAFREWLHPSDVAALAVLPNYTSDVDHFSRRLRADAAARLGLGPATGYEDFDFVTGEAAEMAWGKAQKRLISQHSIEIEESFYIDEPVYVVGDVHTTARTSFSALYATGNIDLSAENEIHEWAHADGVLRLGPSSIALRRISAGTAIEVGNEAWFERLQAPTLRFGSPGAHAPPPAQARQTPASYADLPGAVQQTPSLFLIRGDCALADGKLYRGSLIVTGFLTLGDATTVIGDIKARKGMSIGLGASVEGAVTCEKGIYAGKDMRAVGPVISETDIFIGASAVIGLPDAQTTVSARNIIVENGVTVHGALWAHEVGIVKPA